MADAQHDILAIFTEAVRQESPAARSRYVDEACGSDPIARQRVETLLRAHFDAGNFLGGQSPEATQSLDQPITEKPGAQIGPYKLLQQIGEGGMGVIYMAEQTEPVRRKVALKIIKPGMDTRQVIARFEAERQALALMDHVNIARVFDGGATDSGRPYFVMELVHGVPITKYCDDNHLTPRQRLELFVPVCQAIQHAHQKGIIHRDIKPSNVMVTLYDGKPAPKVIDFGVAKATEQKLTERTLFTQYGTMIGTLEYMSPEQADISALGVDIRSDIYSLGVLLYELLAGSTPLTHKRMKEAAFAEILRMIKEEEPPKPSTRLSDSGEALASISANRHTEPAKLTKLVRGELDWIVMKTLEKDRNRRYETAKDFAADVQRYLDDEQVEACPPSAGYRLKKFVRRNKGPVLAAAAVLLTLVGGIVGTGWQAVRAERALVAQAEQAEGERKAKERAEADFALANEAVETYLGTVTNDPELKQADFNRLRKKLLESALPFFQKLAEQKSDDPDIETRRGRAYGRLGDIRQTMGENEAALQDFEAARAIFIRLSAEFPDVPAYRRRLASSLDELGSTLSLLGKHREAEAAYRQALDIKEKLDAGFPDVPTYRERLANSHNNLGKLLHTHGQREESEAHYRKAVAIWEKLADEFPTEPEYREDLAMSYNNLGDLLADLRRREEAEAFLHQALDIKEKLVAAFPEELDYREDLASSHSSMGSFLDDLGQSEEAEAHHRKALAIWEKLADDFPTVPAYRRRLARGHNSLGVLLNDLGKREDAEAAYRRALAIQEQLVADFPTVLAHALELGGSYCNYGNWVHNGGQPETALDWYQKAIATLNPVVAKESRLVAARKFLRNSHLGNALALDELGRHAEAARDWERAAQLDDDGMKASFHLRMFRNRKDAAGCLAAAAEIEAQKAADAGGLYNAACYRALCAAVIPEDPKTPAADAARLAREQADLAMAWLHKAVAAGYENSRHMKQDKDLDALRDREDFKTLVADVEAKRPLNDRAWELATDPDPSLRDPTRAVELAEKAVAELPKDANCWNTLGVARYRAGDYKGAVAALMKYRELRTNDAEWTNSFFLAMAHWKLDDKVEAAKWYKLAVEWMEQKEANSELMRRVRAEAAELLLVIEMKQD